MASIVFKRARNWCEAERKKIAEVCRQVNDRTYLCKMKGIWYRVVFEAPTKMPVKTGYDYKKKGWEAKVELPRRNLYYQPDPHTKRQLSGKELRKLKLENDRK